MEFIADCGKFDAEIDKEIGKGKFTLAELEEETEPGAVAPLASRPQGP